MEDAAVGEKPWQLTGEVAGPARPENSLLQEHLEYDTAARQAPVITEEVSLNQCRPCVDAPPAFGLCRCRLLLGTIHK